MKTPPVTRLRPATPAPTTPRSAINADGHGVALSNIEFFFTVRHASEKSVATSRPGMTRATGRCWL
jgi:hypothetical protein